MASWKKMDVIAPFTTWTDVCCDILQRCADGDGDFSLSYLVRFASYINAAKDAIYKSTLPSEHQRQLVLFGLEAQSRELRQRMLTHIASSGKHPRILLDGTNLRTQEYRSSYRSCSLAYILLVALYLAWDNPRTGPLGTSPFQYPSSNVASPKSR